MIKIGTMIILPTTIGSLQLTRDITKHLKRGHRWVFSSSFDEATKNQTGIFLLKYKSEILGLGIAQAQSQLRFRVLCLEDEWFFKKNNLQKTLEIYVDYQWKRACALRAVFNLEVTNSFRLLNGEGDGFPGLIIDIYANTAVIKLDQEYLEKIWDCQILAQKIITDFPQVKKVYLKRKSDAAEKGENIIGQLPEETLFKENNLLFASNIRDAAKTGFFLDQRDNRHYTSQFSKNKSVLNLFCYTGGFSIFAAKGGANHVTSVDIAKAAINAVERNFDLNNLKTPRENIATDAFAFVEKEIQAKAKYDLVITDPPSFAPNESSVPQATTAYIKIYSDSIKLTKDNGFFVASSCSSHISHSAFNEIVKEAFSKSKRRGTLIHQGGQPSDHPFPLAMEELRYLKFGLYRLD